METFCTMSCYMKCYMKNNLIQIYFGRLHFDAHFTLCQNDRIFLFALIFYPFKATILQTARSEHVCATYHDFPKRTECFTLNMIFSPRPTQQLFFVCIAECLPETSRWMEGLFFSTQRLCILNPRYSYGELRF